LRTGAPRLSRIVVLSRQEGCANDDDGRNPSVHQRMNPHKAAPELQKPMHALTQHIAGNIDPTLFELVKLYASMLNGCAHCVDIHSNDALEAGETTARLFGLLGWYETPFFTERERAALALTEAATKFGPHGVPDAVYDAARAEFDERELAYLVAAIGLINMWNRFGVTFQLTPPSAAALVH
jgi:AhpD family alkylhydroperoxidase